MLDRLLEFLRWIHPNASAAEFQTLAADAVVRLRAFAGPLPLEARQDGKLIAGAFFKRLPGNVATLGGVRANNGSQPIAVSLVRRLTDELERIGIPQIQAVVNASDSLTEEIIAQAGFERLTYVQHLWLDLLNPIPVIGQQECAGHLNEINWRPANLFARSRIEKLVDSTFEQTMDCPALNELRNQADVLDGLLDGRDFRQVTSWDLLDLQGEHVGCMLLSRHPNQVTELAYAGLIPAARGRKLGRVLLQRAIEQSRALAAEVILSAVDEGNIPALRRYTEFGFQSHQRLSVWLLRRPAAAL